MWATTKTKAKDDKNRPLRYHFWSRCRGRSICSPSRLLTEVELVDERADPPARAQQCVHCRLLAIKTYIARLCKEPVDSLIVSQRFNRIDRDHEYLDYLCGLGTLLLLESENETERATTREV